MKNFLILAALLTLAVTAEAAPTPKQTVIFDHLSTTGNSAAFRGFGAKKTLIVAGYNNADTEAALDGTIVLQCGPAQAGPWKTAKDQAGNAISATAIGTWHLDNICPWYRATWARTTGNIKAWFFQEP